MNASHGLSDNVFILELQGNLCFGPHDDTHMTNDGSLGLYQLLTAFITVLKDWPASCIKSKNHRKLHTLLFCSYRVELFYKISFKPLKNCLHSLLQQLYIYFLGFYPILFFRSMPLSVLLFCLWISAKSVCHNLGRTVCLQSPRLDSRQFPLDLYSKLLQWEDILELANLYSLVQFLRPPKRPHFPSQQGQQADSRVAV